MAVQTALKCAQSGIRPLPIVKGSKKAAVEWEGKSAEMPALVQIQLEFDGDFWIAAQAGRISGGLECIDFDDPECYGPWLDVLEAFGLKQVAESCYVQQTPKGGYHVVYRADGVDWEKAGNLKLASKHTDEGKKTRIETRGEGGYFLIAPSQGYEPKQGALNKLPVLTVHQRRMLLDAARTFNAAPKKPYVTGGTEGTVKPGKDYDAKTDWSEVLTGWTLDHTRNGVGYWIRPGKKRGEGISATTGYAGTDLLYVFSSNAYPFEPDCTYSKFAAYAFLNHGGNFIDAARDLGKRGYGDQARPSAAEAVERAMASVRDDGEWLDETEPEEPEFLWEPYLLKRQLNLVDGKGGTNKSTLLLAIAAMGSHGLTPFGGVCEPFKTAYFTTEDSAGAYASVLRKLGGSAPRSMKMFTKNIPRLDAPGCREIARMVEDMGATNVVFDPIINLCAGVVRNSLDRMEVGPVMERLREHLCYGIGATVTDVRHFAMGASARDIDEMGAGARVWPDTHRSQLVIVSAGGEDPRRYVFHAKASILVKKGKPFAYGWKEGVFGFWHPTPEELAELGFTPDGQKIPKDGSEEMKSQSAKEFLARVLTPEWQRSDDIKRQAKGFGLNPDSGTFKRVQRELVDWKREGYGADAVFYWRSKDPYADDIKPWAGLD